MLQPDKKQCTRQPNKHGLNRVESVKSNRDSLYRSPGQHRVGNLEQIELALGSHTEKPWGFTRVSRWAAYIVVWGRPTPDENYNR